MTQRRCSKSTHSLSDCGPLVTGRLGSGCLQEGDYSVLVIFVDLDFIFVQRFLTQTRVQVLFACFKLRSRNGISSTVAEVTVTEVSFLTSLCSPSFNIRPQ